MLTLIAMLFSFISCIILIPFMRQLAFRIGAVAKPDKRRIHKGIIPQIGGIALYISFLIGLFITQPVEKEINVIMLGATIIIVLGLIDDIYELSAKLKLLGQLLSAFVIVIGGIKITFITLPFIGQIHFGLFSSIMTIIWILAFINAINLIDGLDGLATGISIIGLGTIGLMAMSQQNIFVTMLCAVLIGASIGFLLFNFNPASIFLGDSGAMFLGFMLAVVSLLGFGYKSGVTIASLTIPIIILGVPFMDTVFAIIRRQNKKQSWLTADASHLHHRLMKLGYSTKETVIIIYVIALLFSAAGVVYSLSTASGGFLILLAVFFSIEILVEVTNLISENYRPLLNLLTKLFNNY